jgi:hypothetical protein
MATQAERDSIIAQAKAINPSNPQLAVWQYAQSQGMSPLQVDEYFGWNSGTTGKWAIDNGLLSQNGSRTGAFDTSGMTPRYAKKTIERQGAPMEVDDTSKLLGYTKNNGDGTYSDYSPTGELTETYNPNTGFLGGLSQNLNAIGDDRSKVGSDFVLPALAMAGGASLINGAGGAAELSAGAEALEAGGAGAGTAATSPYSLSQGTGTFGTASQAGTSAALGGTGVGLTGAGLAGAGLLAGAAGSSLIPAALTTAGGLISGNAAADAARTQADAQVRAAQIAADAAKFKPVGVTTNFGRSQFGYDANGNLTSAGYQLTPELQAAMGQLAGQAGGLLNQAGQAQSATAPMATAAQRAMTLGQGYLATDPQAQAQKYLNDQLGLLAPSRAADMAALQAQMQAQGRGGFAIGGGVGGQGAANPQLQALLNAQLQQNNQLAADATKGGMDYAKFGAGMVGTGGDLLSSMYGVQNAAYQPFNTALGTAGTIEGMGQNALTLGMDMGNTVTSANRSSAGLLASGMTNAANTRSAADAYSPWGALLSGAGQATQGYKFDPMTGVRL